MGRPVMLPEFAAAESCPIGFRRLVPRMMC